MCGHATINRLYRLVWSEVQGAWVAVAENTRGRGKRSARRSLAAALFAGLPALSPAAPAPPPTQLPTGGAVAAGNVSITQAGARMGVSQTSQRGIVDWQTFNVGSAAQVSFAQPSAGAVTLNRVSDTQASQIFGRITANGQVFLSNPNGVYFSPGASVDVGGLVATTHTIGAEQFMAGGMTFNRAGASGSVVNEGSLRAALGGYIALLAPEVRNSGLVIAQAGTVALAAGEAIELKFDHSRSLTGVLVSPSTIATLVENGAAVRAPGGLIIMSAQAASSLQSGVVRNTGSLEATGFSMRGGKIVLDASDLIDNSGSLDASGQRGGAIAIKGDRMLSAGGIHADGVQAGGGIATTLANGLVETAGATISAAGDQGGISVDAGAGQLFSSANYHADGLASGQRGGQITLSGAKVVLRGATASADGDAGGGAVLVGGDLHGANPSVRNARNTSVGGGVTLSANAITRGDGGKVVVWSDQSTSFAGVVKALGGAAGGNGGQLEVSGKQDLHFAGLGDAHAPHGVSGQLLLDPKNIYIDQDMSGQQEFANPHQSAGGTFGASVMALTSTSGGTVSNTGYVVVSDPTDNLGATNSGAAYLFRQSDQALISTLYGTHAGDKVGYNNGGIPVTTLTNGNFVLSSALWNGGKGAVTWGNGSTGWGNGATAVSSGNSLVGTLGTFTNSQGYAASDSVGNNGQVLALPNGNFLVADTAWGNNAGALTWGNGVSGTSGVIGSSNSLIGSTVNTQASGGGITYKYGDQVGTGLHILPNGNYVMVDPAWNKGVGAVAFGSGGGGLVGVLGAGNALVGTTSRSDSSGNGSGTDKVGNNFLSLSGSKFLVYSSGWNANAGELTWFDGSTAITGVVSSSNSLVGNANDSLSSGGVTSLGGNNAYVISSPSWSSGKGAATWVPYATDVKGVTISTAGLAGATAGDAVSSKAVTVLADNDYVVSSPSWSGGFGAATLVDGGTGKTKTGASTTISASNSIVGSNAADNVASKGILSLTGNGNYVVLSPTWTNGATANAGAVTWSSGGTPTVGVVSASNSLVGSNANDLLGSYKYTSYNNGDATPFVWTGATVSALSNGNAAIASPMWNGTRGAFTWMNGATGATSDATHVISASNSIIGGNAGDFVGAIAVRNIISSPGLNYDSLSNGITALAGGNFVVNSSYWKNGAVSKAGALTWSNGAGAPSVGALSSGNSLVGGTAGDFDGQYTSVIPLLAGLDGNGALLNSGDYLLRTNHFDSGATVDAGALTWGGASAALTGTISNANSLVGLKTNDVYNWGVRHEVAYESCFPPFFKEETTRVTG